MRTIDSGPSSFRIPAALVFGVLSLVGAVGASFVACAKLERIEPGHVGVSVQKCQAGSLGSGVREVPIPPGYYWRALVCEEVLQYPVSLRTLVLTKNPHEGPDGEKELDQSITVNSSDGMPINVDCSISYTLDGSRVPGMYAKFRKDLPDIERLYMRQVIREGMQEQFARYTTEEVYARKKQEAAASIQKFLSERLAPDGFVVAQFTLNEIRIPDQVRDAINSKVAMVQEAQRAEQEVKKKKAEADQAVAAAEGEARAGVARAEGEAKSKRALADAEAYYNKTVAGSLTESLVRLRALEKWDGHMPQVNGGATPFIQIPTSK
jgi:regulator of protease activity HflC (stomatin/prohibitin superfamily)